MSGPRHTAGGRSARRGRRMLVTGLLAVTFLTQSAPDAFAGSSSGVHLDPGSPAAKQYAVPLATARAGASGGTSTVPFGTGITHVVRASQRRARTAPAASAHRLTAAARHHGGGAVRSDAPTAAAATPHSSLSVPAPARVLGSGSGSAASIAWTVMPGILVLLIGVLAAIVVALRRPGIRR